MIHIILNGQIIETRDPGSWEGQPTVGQDYFFNDEAYKVKKVVVDTRKGCCELTVTPPNVELFQRVSKEAEKQGFSIKKT